MENVLIWMVENLGLEFPLLFLIYMQIRSLKQNVLFISEEVEGVDRREVQDDFRLWGDD